MSFTIVKKSTRRTFGIVIASILTGILIYAFLDSYAKNKRRQVPKTDLVELNIVADAAAAAMPILYEAVPTEECIKQLTFHSSSSMSSSENFSLVSSGAAVPVAANSHVQHSAQSSSKPKPQEPKLVQASSPKCLKQTAAPAGSEQFAKDGFVGLELNLAADGRVERGEVEKTSHFSELDEAALKQVTETWQFEPCKKSSVAVACKTHIRFRWFTK